MSNQDEDEVEEELEALEREIKMPDAPKEEPELTDEQRAQLARERAQRRARDRAAKEEQRAEPIPA